MTNDRRMRDMLYKTLNKFMWYHFDSVCSLLYSVFQKQNIVAFRNISTNMNNIRIFKYR